MNFTQALELTRQGKNVIREGRKEIQGCRALKLFYTLNPFNEAILLWETEDETERLGAKTIYYPLDEDDFLADDYFVVTPGTEDKIKKQNIEHRKSPKTSLKKHFDDVVRIYKRIRRVLIISLIAIHSAIIFIMLSTPSTGLSLLLLFTLGALTAMTLDELEETKKANIRIYKIIENMED